MITIWWKKQSYCDTSKHKWVRFTSLEAIVDVINKAAYPKSKKVAVMPLIEVIDEKDTMQPIEGFISVPVIKNHINYGIQQCIDHILKKAEYGKANGLNPSNIAMLNNLKEELRQYL